MQEIAALAVPIICPTSYFIEGHACCFSPLAACHSAHLMCMYLCLGSSISQLFKHSDSQACCWRPLRLVITMSLKQLSYLCSAPGGWKCYWAGWEVGVASSVLVPGYWRMNESFTGIVSKAFSGLKCLLQASCARWSICRPWCASMPQGHCQQEDLHGAPSLKLKKRLVRQACEVSLDALSQEGLSEKCMADCT